MNIFPNDYGKTNSVDTINKEPRLLKEYAVDFETGQTLKDESGKNIIVDGLEAVKVRNWLALKIQKDRFFIYKGEVGNNLKSLYGKDLAYINKNIKMILEEALIDEYTTAVQDINVTMNDSNYIVDFTVITIYGSYISNESW